ncbi:MAG: hypothetical protein NVS3B26_09380 [Mycobacteriales bacterium]
MAAGTLDAGVVGLYPDDVETGAGEHLSDPGPHGAESDYTDLTELPGHSRPLLTRLVGVKSPRPWAAHVPPGAVRVRCGGL